ncbi:MAG TPA: hypothetical protein VGG16_08915 [Streptosporangiaceae bacterium]
MSERYWRRPMPVAAILLAAAGAAALTGCGSSGSGAASPAGATSTAGLAANAGQVEPAAFTATQLQGALLGKVNGAGPVEPAEVGAYGALPDVRTSKQSMRGVTVTPAKCAQATVTGFNSATFADAPASVATFRVGRDGVSEVIVAASSRTARSALASRLPSGCAHYKATVGGKTFSYAVKESSVPGIAEQARALNVRAAGYADVDVWSVVYRGSGFVGAVTVVGPDATEQGAKVLAAEAYNRAAESLH